MTFITFIIIFLFFKKPILFMYRKVYTFWLSWPNRTLHSPSLSKEYFSTVAEVEFPSSLWNILILFSLHFFNNIYLYDIYSIYYYYYIYWKGYLLYYYFLLCYLLIWTVILFINYLSLHFLYLFQFL
jgi:hypothetical protein